MPATQTETKQPRRMTLANVKRGKLHKPIRVLLYGVEKIGKSTFAAGAPDAIFICPEDGTAQLDVARFPEPQNWSEVLDALDALRTEDHDHKHVVLDTLDWLEPMLWEHICDRDGEKNIEAYGYGKGYTAALDEWRKFIARLEQLRAQRSMGVVLLAHSWIKAWKNPDGKDFDRYEMKLNVKAGGLVKEWCDAVLFANFETLVSEDKNKRVRGVSTGARFVYTQRSATYDAGNRFDLPPELPLDWGAFADAMAQGGDPAVIRARIDEMLEGVNGDLAKRVSAALEKPEAKDPSYLARVMNKLAATISNQENVQ